MLLTFEHWQFVKTVGGRVIHCDLLKCHKLQTHQDTQSWCCYTLNETNWWPSFCLECNSAMTLNILELRDLIMACWNLGWPLRWAVFVSSIWLCSTTILTWCSQVMLEKLIVCPLVTKFSTFYGPRHSLDSYFPSLRRPDSITGTATRPFNQHGFCCIHIGTSVDTVCHQFWIHSRRMEMHLVSDFKKCVEFVYF